MVSLLTVSFQLKHKIDVMKLELSMHTLVSGRTRKNIKLIESATKTAIYFPPPFPNIFGYIPQGATRRAGDEVFITGESQERITQAKQKLKELVQGTKLFVKDVMVSSSKIDSILLDRLDKVRKVMETNGTHVIFPQLGSQRGMIRIQGTEVLHIERTVREIMALVSLLIDFVRPIEIDPGIRQDNSTALVGGSWSPIHHKVECFGLPPLLTSVQCFPTFVSILVPT